MIKLGLEIFERPDFDLASAFAGRDDRTSSAHPMLPPSLASTYGSWLISLFLETILYGIGVLQTFLYFQWWPTDNWAIQGPVVIVMLFETSQITFFFSSTYYRFVQKFGEPQVDLIWSDSFQLLANYLTVFTVQMYLASRIYRLTRESIRMHRTSSVGIYIVILLAFVQISAGIAQTILSYQLRSYSKLEQTKATTILQTAASLACDVVITVHLCVFLARNKDGMPRTQKMLNSLIMNAVIRGILTAASSAATMILFLVFPNTFWFFLSLAPNSKLYMNSMLAVLNMRQHIRDKALPNGWGTIDLGELGSNGPGTGRSEMVSAVEFVKPEVSVLEVGIGPDQLIVIPGPKEEEETVPGTKEESAYPSTDSTATETA
ncbi:hypothetical protein B0H13DRAFT_2302718 [Mycena leptocephala]|nr:hypothetical protein B0H13DRAFT_2302718 [Mycena leptocephala]